MNEGGKKEHENIPSSWNYGSFHFQSRLYTSFMNKERNQNKAIKTKYEPLNQTNAGITTKINTKVPSQSINMTKGRRKSKIEKVRGNLRMDEVEPRKVFTSTGWQRTSKSAE